MVRYGQAAVKREEVPDGPGIGGFGVGHVFHHPALLELARPIG